MSSRPEASPSPEGMSVLRDMLSRLPDAIAQAAVYFYCDEMTHEEIARVMKCSRRHVGNLIERMHRAIKDLETT
jgi:DNA-directed RNA polymerase specialized sigma24 family protein